MNFTDAIKEARKVGGDVKREGMSWSIPNKYILLDQYQVNTSIYHLLQDDWEIVNIDDNDYIGLATLLDVIGSYKIDPKKQVIMKQFISDLYNYEELHPVCQTLNCDGNTKDNSVCCGRCKK